MTMKIELDFSDIFCEEGEELKKSFLSHIAWQVQEKVWESVDVKVQEKLTEEICGAIIKKVENKINLICEEFVNKNEITVIDKKISIDEYINDIFNNASSWGGLRSMAVKKAEEHAKDLKARYDIAFANRIVLKIHEQGLLKDDIAKLLLSD